MSFQDSTWTIVGGSEVLGSDGEKLGSVDRIEGDNLIVKKGWFFPSDHRIPTSAIASVDDGVVMLNVSKDTALDQGWDTFEDEDVTTDVASAPRAFDGGTAAYAGTAEGVTGFGGDDNSDSGSLADDTLLRNDSETIRVPLAEEELTATRREVERGAVRIEKDVIAQEETLDVPVTEERVNVERHAVDRDVQAGDTTFEGGTIEVPVYGEEVDVQKQARVREELEISKDAVEQTEHVTETVRREDARIVDSTDAVGRDNDTNRR